MHERRRLIVVARSDAVALGIALEYAQLYSGWRDFEIGDLVADVAGVCCGLGAALVLRSTRRVFGFDRSLLE
jgi:VanZ family protein